MSHVGSESQDSHGHVSPVLEDTPETLELEEEYIIPKHLTRDQWNRILFEEDTDETVGEIMDGFMGRVMDGCLRSDIDKELIPYTMHWLEGSITAAVEQQVLCLDAGYGSEEVSRNEDSEPIPTSDPWVQGTLPVVYVSPKALQVPIQTKPRENKQTDTSPKQSERRASPRRPARAPHPAPKNDGKENPKH